MDKHSWVFLAVVAIVAIANLILSLFGSSKESGKQEGSVNAKIEGFEKFMQDIREDLDKIRQEFREDIGKIREDINRIFRALPHDTVKRTSPIQLTDLGKKVSEETQALLWAKQTAPTLTAQNRDKGHYDIQEFCLDYVKKESVLSEEMDKRVKSSAYSNGIEKEQVLRVLAVELRDAIFKQLKMDKDAEY